MFDFININMLDCSNIPTMVEVLKKRIAVKKAHVVGSSIVITIDPEIAIKHRIDDMTYLTQESTDEGILMKIRRLS